MSTIYTPLKRKYAIEDSFFEQGNIALRALRLKKQATDDFEKEIIQQEEVALTV
jgi:hypothetical protein